jgi:hypothetical protein
MALNKYMYLKFQDASDMYEEHDIPADGLWLVASKHDGMVTVEVVSIGHYIESGMRGDTDINGLVIRNADGLLWQARYETGRHIACFMDLLGGWVKFTRVEEVLETRRVFREVR